MKRNSLPNKICVKLAWFGMIAIIALAVSCSLKSCMVSDKVITSLIIASDMTSDLGEVVLIVGADKVSWGTLAHGESVGAILNPMGEPPEVFMTYVLAGQKLSWEGPRLSKGAGYRIHIFIDSHGGVSEQHCTQPCRLP